MRPRRVGTTNEGQFPLSRRFLANLAFIYFYHPMTPYHGLPTDHNSSKIVFDATNAFNLLNTCLRHLSVTYSKFNSWRHWSYPSYLFPWHTYIIQSIAWHPSSFMKHNYDRHVLHDLRTIHTSVRNATPWTSLLCGTSMPISAPLLRAAGLLFTYLFFCSFLVRRFGRRHLCKGAGRWFHSLSV